MSRGDCRKHTLFYYTYERSRSLFILEQQCFPDTQPKTQHGLAWKHLDRALGTPDEMHSTNFTALHCLIIGLIIIRQWAMADSCVGEMTRRKRMTSGHKPLTLSHRRVFLTPQKCKCQENHAGFTVQCLDHIPSSHEGVT
jgi:hypothetical protein